MTDLRSFCNVQKRKGLARLSRWVFTVVGILLVSCLPIYAMGTPREHPGETESGMASWYGASQGHHTASGERFNPHALTAAHRHLPFGTIIHVTNNMNGKSVDLRINDRGPWRGHRILDVSDEAATELDMKRAGTVPVTIVVIKLGLGHYHHS